MVNGVGAEISAPTPGKEIWISTQVWNLGRDAENVTMLAVQYDKNGVLVSVDSVEHVLESGDQISYRLEEMKIKGSTTDLKVFVWETQTLKPVEMDIGALW